MNVTLFQFMQRSAMVKDLDENGADKQQVINDDHWVLHSFTAEKK